MSTTTAPVIERPRRRAFGRFSLRTLLVVMILLCVGGSHVLTSRRLRDAEGEIVKLRAELGYLTIKDKTQLAAVQVPSVEDLIWTWRVYVPPGQTRKVLMSIQNIPQTGLPDSGNGTVVLTGSADPATVTVAVRRDHKDQWGVLVKAQGGSVTMSLPPKAAEWLHDNYGSMTGGVSVGQTQQFPNDKPVELLRHRILERMNGGNLQAPTGTSDGILVWIAPLGK